AWTKLAAGQRERLEQLGIGPLPAPKTAAVKGRQGTSEAFERGAAALRQYKARTGSVTAPRAHVEVLEDGTEVKLGIWLSNTKSRRAKLTTDQLAQLADLGLDWA
ncbi:helicase associated domain-containing protein, partial [Streptomyces purpurogeneiscleroticus]|uniref:helicase associated domain-containing protein n=1 Tax=Streptomyces purpurogeneiscleroticus TaxID=68259 RepID=UPI001CBCA3E0